MEKRQKVLAKKDLLSHLSADKSELVFFLAPKCLFQNPPCFFFCLEKVLGSRKNFCLFFNHSAGPRKNPLFFCFFLLRRTCALGATCVLPASY